MTKEELFEKNKQFDKELAALEEKHKDYFSERTDSISSHILARHEIFDIGADNHMITWEKETDLSADIRQEAENIFKAIYRT